MNKEMNKKTTLMRLVEWRKNISITYSENDRIYDMTKENKNNNYKVFHIHRDVDLIGRIINEKTEASGTGAVNPENGGGSETGKGLRILYKAAIDRVIHLFTCQKGKR